MSDKCEHRVEREHNRLGRYIGDSTSYVKCGNKAVGESKFGKRLCKKHLGDGLPDIIPVPRAEYEAMKRDVERIDGLIAISGSIERNKNGGQFSVTYIDWSTYEDERYAVEVTTDFETGRGAIDAAIAAAKGKGVEA